MMIVIVWLSCFREDHDKIEEQKKWLDCEVEKIVQQKKEVEHLQEVCIRILWENGVSMLACSFLIDSSSKLLVIRTNVNARASLILGLWFPKPNLLSSGVLDDMYFQSVLDIWKPSNKGRVCVNMYA